MPVGAEPKPRFQSCCISILFFITLTFFLCLVGGFTLLVSGGRYGRGENMQGFWWKIFNRPAGRIEKFSPKPAGREAALQIFRGPVRSFAPWTTQGGATDGINKNGKIVIWEKENWNTAGFGRFCHAAYIKKTYMGMYSLTRLYINCQIVSKIYCYWLSSKGSKNCNFTFYYKAKRTKNFSKFLK